MKEKISWGDRIGILITCLLLFILGISMIFRFDLATLVMINEDVFIRVMGVLSIGFSIFMFWVIFVGNKNGNKR